MRRKKILISSIAAVCCATALGAVVIGVAESITKKDSTEKIISQDEVTSVLKNINGCSFESGVETPAETLVPYRGVKVTTDAGGVFSFQYNGIYDLTEGEDFIRFLILPEIMGQVEMDDFVITLTDVYDEDKYLKMDFRDGAEITYMMNSWIMCSYSDKYKGLGYEWNGVMTDAGTSHTTSWRGYVPGYTDWVESVFYFDVENNEIRTRKLQWTTDHGFIQEHDMLIFDFEEPSLGANVFEGFTSNEVYITVEITASSSNAHMLVTQIAGVDLSGDTIQEKAPKITVDYGNYDKNNLPYGVASAENSYPVYNAVAYSPQDGVFDVNDVKVLYGGRTIPVQNGRFATKEEGLYQIVYSATSKNGNTVSKTVEVEVVPTYEVPCMYEFDTSIPDVAYVGTEKVYLPDGRVYGGYGDISVKRSLKAGGDDIPVYRSGKAEYFIPEVKSGTQTDYILSYEVQDITGKTLLFSKTITVKIPTEPTISEAIVPGAVRVGYPTNFVIPTAYKIEGGQKIEVPVTMKVNNEICNGQYIPTQAGVYNVEYIAGETTKKYSFTALDKPTSENANNWYFLPNGFTFKEATTKYVGFTRNTENATLEFANALCADTFSFSFDVSKRNVQAVKVTLSDSLNSLETVEFRIQSLKTGLPVVYVCDEYLGSLTGSFTEDIGQYITFDYNSSQYLISQNKKIAKIPYYANGEKFNGFSSGAVYLKVEIIEGDIGSDIQIVNVAGHSFNQDVTDYRKPDISFDQEVALTRAVEFGEKFTVYAAKGWDVFSSVKTMTVQVNNPKNKNIYSGECDRDIIFDADMLGAYNIVYVATDENGWTQRLYYTVNVVDVTSPVISEDIAVKKVYQVGEKGTWGQFVATDNSGTDVKTYCYIIIPTGEWKVIDLNNGKYEYTFNEKGLYKVCFAAIDASMNMAYLEYDVTVK